MTVSLASYVDTYIMSSNIDRDLFGRMLTAVHLEICGGNELAVSFPDWNDKPGKFGIVFRVFGTEAGLQAYLERIRLLEQHNLVRNMTIEPTPETENRVVFLRDRSLDKYSPAQIRRMESRALARGETFTPQSAPAGLKHSIPMLSISGKAPFSLFIRKANDARQTTTGNRYGLGLAVPEF